MAKAARVLHVENLTHPATPVDHGRVADNFFTRLRGLIGVRDLPAGDGMWIRPSNSVHCMFMSIPIDVVYLNKAGEVIAMDRNMKPWRVGGIHTKCASVLELPAGRIDGTGIAVGDTLRLSIV